MALNFIIGGSLRVRLCSSVGIQGVSKYPGSFSRPYSQYFNQKPVERRSQSQSFSLSQNGVRLLGTSTTTSVPSPVLNEDLATTPITIPPSSTPTDILETSSTKLWASDVAQTLAEGETFASLGLGGYSPVGFIQSTMELVYNSTGLPWWGAIVASTLCLRVLFYPLSLFMQKNSAKLHKVSPQVEKLKEKQQMYTMAGNLELANYERHKMGVIFKENGIRPVLGVVPAVFQAVLMVSFFMALRGMANAPVVTMETGGALWFLDLSVPDPLMILPVVSSVGFLISLELGGDTGVVNPQLARMKSVMRVMSVLMIGITYKMPAGIFMYWLTSSSFSICNALMLKIPGWRAIIGVEEVTRQPEAVKSEKRTWNENRKIRNEIEGKKQKLKKAKKEYERLRSDPNIQLYSTKPPTNY